MTSLAASASKIKEDCDERTCMGGQQKVRMNFNVRVQDIIVTRNRRFDHEGNTGNMRVHLMCDHRKHMYVGKGLMKYRRRNSRTYNQEREAVRFD